MKTDDTMRAQLLDFDPAAHASLTSAERDRIATDVTLQGPLLIARARRVHLAQRAGAVGLAAAAALALGVVRPWHDAETPGGQPVVAMASKACATDLQDAQPSFVTEPDGRSRLKVGDRAQIIAEANSQVSVQSLTPCSTQLALVSGHVTVHARDLGGGELVVNVHDTQVVVRGTLFSVDATGADVRVAVEHGRVSVRGEHGELASVAGNEAVELRAGSARHVILSSDERISLRTALEVHTAAEPPATVVPQPTQPVGRGGPRAASPRLAPGALLGSAERAWRAGDRETARRLFRRAGGLSGATAEAAWLRLSRLELRDGKPSLALSALRGRKQRFGKGTLAAEATWLEVQALERLGRHVEARSRAAQLIATFPDSPQASAARRLVRTTGKP